MIQFMLLAAPRSATAWCANWLTTERSLCLHEPLSQWSHEQLDQRACSRTFGIACTTSALLSINRHPARKVVLHRDPAEVRASMALLRIEGDYDFTALDNVQGQHYSWTDVFENPKPIYEYLLEQPFDAERHDVLRGLNIQNMALIRELQHAS